MPPTENQLRAIKKQSQFPGVNTTTPNTFEAASAQISANSQTIQRYQAGIALKKNSNHGERPLHQSTSHRPPPSEKTMIKIREAENKLGYFSSTHVDVINAPKSQYEAVGLLRKLIEKLRGR